MERKFKLKNMNIGSKIFIILLGFCAVLLMMLWLFQIVFLDDFYERIKIKEVQKSAVAIVNNIENTDLQYLVERISESNGVCVELVAKSGTELYSAHVLYNCVIHKMPTLEKMLLYFRTEENGGELLEYYDREGFKNIFYSQKDFSGDVPPPSKTVEETIIYAKTMLDSQDESVILLINSVISPVEATVNTLRVQLYYVTAFLVLFATTLAFFIARSVSKPIVSINESAKIMAKGNLDVKFEGGGYKEINELTSTLNYTANELAKVDRLKNELIANIGHDLRTPLTLISGYAEAMRDLPFENTPENAQIIVEETKRLTTLVNDVMDISKLQSGTGELKMRPYSITESIKSTAARLSELLKKEEYKIEFFYDDEIFVRADEQRITQVFYNLLSNAITHTGEGKEVRVVQTACNGRVKIEVIDNGEGIAPEEIEFIWERYYKGSKAHKRGVTGTGLGLSIVKNIVEQHGGTCGVYSNKGEGSTFWFEIATAKK